MGESGVCLTRQTFNILCLVFLSLDNHKSEGGGVVAYQPPLRDPDVDLKRTMRKLTKLSQDAQK